MAPPLVSVALCTYNGARYLEQQLQSLSAQTHAALEIVAVDDGSTDGTVELLQSHSMHEPRLRVFVNPANLGLKRNFEKALSLCQGAFISPCDQDDIWAPEKTAVLLAAIGTHAMAYCDSELIDDDARPLGVRVSDIRRLGPIHSAAPFAFGNCVSGHAMLFRQSLLARAMPIADGFFHDWWLAAVAASQGGVVYADRCLVQYRQHEGSVTDIRSHRPRNAAASRGRRLRRSREQGARIAALAALPGRDQALLRRLGAQWGRRDARWLTPGLFLLMLCSLGILQRFEKRSLPELALGCLKYLSGLKLKTVFNPRAYAAD